MRAATIDFTVNPSSTLNSESMGRGRDRLGSRFICTERSVKVYSPGLSVLWLIPLIIHMQGTYGDLRYN